MAVVESVRGPVDLGSLGQTLMHEHVFVLATEHVQNYGTDWWDEETRVADAIAKLNAVYAKGIVPMPGVSLDVPAVLGYLGEHIADFKIPQYVAVSATPLPRNPGGKLLKRRLREDTDWASAARR